MSSFAFKDKAKEKHSSHCRSCQSNYAKSHYSRNKEKVKKWVNDGKAKIRNMFHEYLRNKSCIDCGNSDIRVLEFDHKVPEEKTATVSVLVHNGVSWDKIMNEINKCDIRCANCHKIKTSKQFSWSKSTR